MWSQVMYFTYNHFIQFLLAISFMVVSTACDTVEDAKKENESTRIENYHKEIVAELTREINPNRMSWLSLGTTSPSIAYGDNTFYCINDRRLFMSKNPYSVSTFKTPSNNVKGYENYVDITPPCICVDIVNLSSSVIWGISQRTMAAVKISKYNPEKYRIYNGSYTKAYTTGSYDIMLTDEGNIMVRDLSYVDDYDESIGTQMIKSPHKFLDLSVRDLNNMWVVTSGGVAYKMNKNFSFEKIPQPTDVRLIRVSGSINGIWAIDCNHYVRYSPFPLSGKWDLIKINYPSFIPIPMRSITAEWSIEPYTLDMMNVVHIARPVTIPDPKKINLFHPAEDNCYYIKQIKTCECENITIIKKCDDKGCGITSGK